MITNVYVDGFNLYYGCLRGTPYKWLDLDALARRLLPRNTIHRVRYFTARVTDRPGDRQQQRQQVYLRALATHSHLTIHLGHFLTHVTRMPLAHPLPGGPLTVEVIKTEEKGSDVNLATYLLLDAFRRDCEVAVVLSNDSDLKQPVALAHSELGITVGIINPHPAARRSRAFESGSGTWPCASSLRCSRTLVAGSTSRPRGEAPTRLTAKARRSGPCTWPPKRPGGWLHGTAG